MEILLMSQQDPNHSQAASQAEFTICHDCCAKLPSPDFNIAKYSPTGRSYICKHCRAQYLRLSRRAKGSNSKIDDSVIRSVLGQNTGILYHALSQKECTLYGFVPHTDKVFKVHFGRSRYDFPSMAIFNTDGSTYQEYAYSGIKEANLMNTLIGLLKEHGIRLELSEIDIQVVKQAIYFY